MLELVRGTAFIILSSNFFSNEILHHLPFAADPHVDARLAVSLSI